jgi:hypothetical protein
MRTQNTSKTTWMPGDHYNLDRIRELVVASRAAQGLPPVIVDELTLGRVAEILWAPGAA